MASQRRNGCVGESESAKTAFFYQQTALLATLAILSSLKTALGDLDRVSAWLVVSGYVNADPGYRQTTAVMNAFSELILQIYGAEAGTHARTAIGVATLPLNLPVVIAAEVEVTMPIDATGASAEATARTNT